MAKYGYLSECKEILKEWNYEKNIDLDTNKLAKGSHKKAWWKCKNNHEWNESIRLRTMKGYGCPYCSGRRASKEYNFLLNNPHLKGEWDYEKNKGLKPEDFTPNSTKEVWWKCGKGHSWKTKIVYRNNGSGCHLCNYYVSFQEASIFYYMDKLFKKVYLQRNINNMEVDIFIEDINLIVEYDGYYHKKDSRYKKDISKTKDLKDLGYEVIRIRSKVLEELKITNCYVIEEETVNRNEIEKSLRKLIDFIKVNYCINIEVSVDITRDYSDIISISRMEEKENSIVETNKELMKEWNYEKNKGIDPNKLTYGSNVIVWWKCKNGHEWKTPVSYRALSGRGCGRCSRAGVLLEENFIKNKAPHLLEEFDFDRNKDIDINKLSVYSRKKVWWKCKKGHKWSALVSNRFSGKDCPYCKGKLASEEYNLSKLYPDIAKELIDDTISSNELTPFSNRKLKWKCSKCDNEYIQYVYQRTKYNRGCKECK